MNKYFYLLLFVSAIVFQGWNCSDDLTPTGFDPSKFPAAPNKLNVNVDDGRVILTWTHTNLPEIDYFNIYRKRLEDSTYAKIDTTGQSEYIDINITNSVFYNYAIAAVKNNIEGARKISNPVRLGVYGIIINSGAEFTNSRSVVLTLIAPSRTEFMRLANDSTFASAIWEPYFGTKNWMLTENDGLKTVYVHYRDAQGNETFTPSKALITLDRQAVIHNLTHTAANVVKSAGDTIHFVMNTGEAMGEEAVVDIGTERTNIKLYDDGTNGDDLRDDGIYKRNYVIPPSFEVVDASVVGHFSDRLGNAAEDFQAKDLLTIQNSPNQVTLLQPERIQGSFKSLRITWTRSNDADFASYKLYRSTSPGVAMSSTFVASIEDVNNLNYTDTGLDENTTYYYKLFVFDRDGNSTESNEVNASTAQNEQPEAVTLISAEAISGESRSLQITWTQNEDDDFANYRLYRSKNPGVSLSSTPVTTITSAATLTFKDTGLEENITYYYVMYVYDTGGLFSMSNEVSGTTNENEAPEQITVFTPTPVSNSHTSLKLSWTQSPDTDFASYRIFRALNSPVRQDCTFVESIESVNTLTYTDANLTESTRYFYKIYVYDTGGKWSESNEVSGITSGNTAPSAVSLLPIETIPGSTTSLRLAWTQNNDTDFASYKIYRSLTPGVDVNSIFVNSIENQSQLSYTDTGLLENTTYYYKVYVYDTGGLFSFSNEQSKATPANEPPTAVTLFKPETIESEPTTLRISWTENTDSDFSNYRIYRSKSSNVTTSSTFVQSITDVSQTSFLDQGLDENTTYYYKIYVFDAGGLSTGSNEEFNTTLVNEPPSSVTLAQPIPRSGTTLELNWTPSSADDFESYRIFRSTSTPVDTTGAPIDVISNSNTTTYSDSNITVATIYYYRVFVYDTNGLSAGSNEVQGEL